MKKIVFLLFIIVLISCLLTKKYEVLIPKEAIRIRVIADSNSIEDQKQKSDIKNEITNYLYERLENIDNYEEANIVIKDNINQVKNIISKYTNNYEVEYGNNYFPRKEYKGVNYNAGDYKSLVVTLGEGKGRNFWCVLFPPLCMIDETKLNNVSYGFFVSELLKKVK